MNVGCRAGLGEQVAEGVALVAVSDLAGGVCQQAHRAPVVVGLDDGVAGEPMGTHRRSHRRHSSDIFGGAPAKIDAVPVVATRRALSLRLES